MAVPDLFKVPPPDEDEEQAIEDFMNLTSCHTFEIKARGPIHAGDALFMNADGTVSGNGANPRCSRCGTPVERLERIVDEARRKMNFCAYCHGEEDSAWMDARQWAVLSRHGDEQSVIDLMKPFQRKQIEGGPTDAQETP